VLGNPRLDRLAIVSFGLRHPSGLLHGNFVVALLTDLFGIQSRSGCFYAGPYLHRLYPVDDEGSARMHAEVLRGHLGRSSRSPPASASTTSSARRCSGTSSTPCT
jgi:selenocysteine lyase/cysteine desulfurase